MEILILFSDFTLPTCTSQTSLHMGFPDYEIGSKSEPSVAAAGPESRPAHIRECGLPRSWTSTDFGNPVLELQLVRSSNSKSYLTICVFQELEKKLKICSYTRCKTRWAFGSRGCPERLCILHPWRCLRIDSIKPQKASSGSRADPALTRRLGYRTPDVFSRH